MTNMTAPPPAPEQADGEWVLAPKAPTPDQLLMLRNWFGWKALSAEEFYAKLLAARPAPAVGEEVAELIEEAHRRLLLGDLRAPGGHVGTPQDLSEWGLIHELTKYLDRFVERLASQQGEKT